VAFLSLLFSKGFSHFLGNTPGELKRKRKEVVLGLSRKRPNSRGDICPGFFSLSKWGLFSIFLEGGDEGYLRSIRKGHPGLTPLTRKNLSQEGGASLLSYLEEGKVLGHRGELKKRSLAPRRRGQS